MACEISQKEWQLQKESQYQEEKDGSNLAQLILSIVANLSRRQPQLHRPILSH